MESVPSFIYRTCTPIVAAGLKTAHASTINRSRIHQPAKMQSARLLLSFACGAAAFSASKAGSNRHSKAGSNRHLALRGAIADFCERTFEIDGDEASDIEARVVAASPRATRQTYQYAVKDPNADDDDKENLEARYAEVTNEFEARRDGLRSLGLGDPEIKRIARRVPEVLSFSAARVKAAAQALQTNLALDDATLRKKVILRLPQALGLRYDVDVAPTFDLLRNDYGFADEDIRALVLGAPQILGLDASAVSSKFAALEASLGSRAAAKAEALRKPAALELEVRGSKRGSVAA
jgi:hypothetical protein